MTRLPLLRHAATAATATVLALVLVACSHGPGAPEPTGGTEPTGADAPGDVGVQLFQWTWDAIATECTDELGPAGFSWVLTSPPQEHVLGAQWWTAYQPVSYRVESRLGTRAQFADMVATCHAAGVEVVADAVLNHMTGQDAPGAGWAGSTYSHDEYPGTWSDADFHHCGLTTTDDITSYQDVAQVQTCELVNLADLATETPQVRDRLLAYLEDLLSLGIDGFRIDAAKHMPAADVEAIVHRLPAGTRIISEVIRGRGEPIAPEDYLGSGGVFEFAWGRDVAGMVRGGSLRLATELGGGPSYLPSEQAWIFVENHDTERGSSTLGHDDGADFVLASVLMLATDYGHPVLYSGYAFSDTDTGPRQDPDGAVLDASCPAPAGPEVTYADGDWVCQHRWPAVQGMVGWRNAGAGEPVTARWDDGSTVAFSRGERGLVVLNGAQEVQTVTVPTTLPDGVYCDVVAGPPTSDGCAGGRVTVQEGTAAVVVPAHAAVAMHVGARAAG